MGSVDPRDLLGIHLEKELRQPINSPLKPKPELRNNALRNKNTMINTSLRDRKPPRDLLSKEARASSWVYNAWRLNI